MVYGFKKSPLSNKCYKMVVQFRGTEEFCYSFVPVYRICRGWEQDTPKFALVTPTSAYYLPRNEWIREYKHIMGDRDEDE